LKSRRFTTGRKKGGNKRETAEILPSVSSDAVGNQGVYWKRACKGRSAHDGAGGGIRGNGKNDWMLPSKKKKEGQGEEGGRKKRRERGKSKRSTRGIGHRSRNIGESVPNGLIHFLFARPASPPSIGAKKVTLWWSRSPDQWDREPFTAGNLDVGPGTLN